MSIFHVSDWMANENEDVRMQAKAIDPAVGRLITRYLIEGRKARDIAAELGRTVADVRAWEKAHIFEIREGKGLRADGTPKVK